MQTIADACELCPELSDEEQMSDDESQLHGIVGNEHCGCDPPPASSRSYLGRFVANEFSVDGQEHPSLFTGEVMEYDQRKKLFSVRFYLRTIHAHMCLAHTTGSLRRWRD